jgi:transcriptional regulator with XRE-family HTH domain
MTFYDRIKELVKKNTSMTLESFIQSMGINYGTYQTQRKAKNLPRADEAQKIAAALDTSVEYLVTGEHPAGISPEDMQLFDQIIKLEKPDREEIAAIIGVKLARYTKYDSRTARTG